MVFAAKLRDGKVVISIRVFRDIVVSDKVVRDRVHVGKSEKMLLGPKLVRNRVVRDKVFWNRFDRDKVFRDRDVRLRDGEREAKFFSELLT